MLYTESGYEYHLKTHPNEHDNAGGLISPQFQVLLYFLFPLSLSFSHIRKRSPPHICAVQFVYKCRFTVQYDVFAKHKPRQKNARERCCKFFIIPLYLLTVSDIPLAPHARASRAPVFGFNKCYLHSAHSF